jgi:Domain of unknown function (DUF1905)
LRHGIQSIQSTMSTFSTTICLFDETNLWGYHILVPMAYAEPFLSGDKRVVCTINNEDTFQCALMSNGKGDYMILVNKQRCKKLNLRQNSPILVHLEQDTSQYGLPMPEELQEMLCYILSIPPKIPTYAFSALMRF